MHLPKSIIAGTAALAIVPASSAVAATISGGPGNERLKGTNVTDAISGNAGNDRLWGRAGDDQLDGGAGYDRLFGGTGNDTLAGGDARDRIYGGAGDDKSSGGTGNDVQDGGPGNDRIFANLGQDTSYGGDGNDDLWTLARGDVQAGVGGSGSVDQTGDTLDGGNGDDRFHTRDGEVDRITCGPGNDVALLDNVDVITDATAANPNGSCEKVIRHAPKQHESKSEDAQQSPAAANPPS